MKITFILAATDLSGGNRVIAIYAAHLQHHGHQVTVVSRPRRPVTLKAKTLAWLRNQPIPKNQKVWASHFDRLEGVQFHRINSYRAITAADVPDADVVVATWWETAEWIAAYPSNKGAKAYFIQHYEAHPGQDAKRVDATWRLPMHKIIIARWLVNMARDKFGDTNISYVPNAVDLEQFNAPPRDKQPTPTVGVMYSIVPFKDCQVSLRAFELARQHIPNLRLVSFGNRRPVADLPLPTGTDYTIQPAQDRIKDIYAQCDAWLIASRSEGFGLPLLEAMACRTPVIATPTGAAPELIAEGGGVLVPIQDPRGMAREIERITTLPSDHWRQMSDAAHATATRYTWDDAAAQFESALEQLAQQGRRA